MTRKSAALDYKYASMRMHTEAQCREMASLTNDGHSVLEIRKRFGGGRDTICKAIQRGGAVPKLVKPMRYLSQDDIERIENMASAGFLKSEIGAAIGRSMNTVSQYLRRKGIQTARKVGPKCPTWKGGEFIHHGYVMAWTARDDALAAQMRNQLGYVLKHRLVMARHLGRALLSTETVHHVNGDKTDNRIENLQLRQGRHGKGTAMHCLDCGSHRIGYAPLKDIH